MEDNVQRTASHLSIKVSLLCRMRQMPKAVDEVLSVLNMLHTKCLSRKRA